MAYVGSLFGEGQRHSPPDARIGSGDEGYFAVQFARRAVVGQV